jgi:hypothetical protein
MNHSLPASTTTTVRLYALTHLHTHTPYYAIRNRSEMFDLSRSFLAQIAAEQKKVWFLYGFSVMFIGGIYRIKRNWKDNDQKRKLYYLLITWRKSENYTFKLYLFSTAAGRIKSSLTEDSKYTYRNARTGAKSWTQEFFYPRVTS